MSRLPKKEIRRVAWHEAGHALYSLLRIDTKTRAQYGHPSFVGSWVAREVGELAPEGKALRMEAKGVLLAGTGDIWCSDMDEIGLNMAGIAAERILIRRKKLGKVTARDVFSGASDGIFSAHAVVEKHNADPYSKFRWNADHALDEGLADAWLLLTHFRPALEAIADALIEKGYLSYEEVKELFERTKHEALRGNAGKDRRHVRAVRRPG
jgi:hypothetical protein